MQLITSQEPTDSGIWWPHPNDLVDLTVDFTVEGWELSAPAGTKCAEWINYYCQTPELEEKFRTELTRILTNHAQSVIHGQTKVSRDSETGTRQEEVPSRERAVHKTLCDI